MAGGLQVTHRKTINNAAVVALLDFVYIIMVIFVVFMCALFYSHYISHTLQHVVETVLMNIHAVGCVSVYSVYSEQRAVTV